ncbi:MAG: hypothetical protein R2769_07390 [Saprospiraceae bacterium]
MQVLVPCGYIYQLGTAVENADYYGNEIYGVLTGSSTSSTVRGSCIFWEVQALLQQVIFTTIKYMTLSVQTLQVELLKVFILSSGTFKKYLQYCISDLRSSVSSTTGITGIYVASGTEITVSYTIIFLVVQVH